ncbi:MAG: hypothetical protein AAF434_00490 [Pseudomonadota bacterium]
MATVEKLTLAHFDDLYAAYLHEEDGSSKKEQWQRLFKQYHPDHDDGGRVLVDKGTIVGMLGTLWSYREINNAGFDFCNVHSWYVHDDYRAYSMRMIYPILTAKGAVITGFTPSAHVIGMSVKSGFHFLDARVRVLLPINSRVESTVQSKIMFDRDEILSHATDHQRQIINDHPAPDFGVCMIVDRERSCLMIYCTVTRHYLNYCYLLHVSDIALFAESAHWLRSHLTRATGSSYVAVDERRCEGHAISKSLLIPLSSNHMTRGDLLKPSQIDALYTEVAFLKLTTFPAITYALNPMRKRYPRSLYAPQVKGGMRSYG